MNEKELKEQLLAAGATEEQIAKINFARIEEIISQAGNLDDSLFVFPKTKFTGYKFIDRRDEG